MANASKSLARRRRPDAVVRAEHHRPAVSLTAPEKKLLEEAIRLGVELQAKTEASLIAYGAWLLQNVFDGDTAAALDDDDQRPVWLELVRRASGRTLGLGRTTLYTCLRVVALDRRLNDGAWRNLDYGRKALLVPLREPAALKRAARHVIELDLPHRQVRDYVASQLADAGRAKQLRVSPTAIGRRVRAVSETLADPQVLRRFTALRSELSDEDKSALEEELVRLRDILTNLTKALRGRA